MTHEGLALTLRRSVDEPGLFGNVYGELFDRILAYHVRRILDEEVALDLTAESFAQAFISRKRFRGSTPPEAEAWVFRIAQRQLTRYLRRGKLERKALNRLGIQVPQVTEDAREEIERLADLHGVRMTIRSELRRLSNEQQEAIKLRVIDELAYSEVARALNISEQAARLRVSRGLRSLATALKDNTAVKEVRT